MDLGDGHPAGMRPNHDSCEDVAEDEGLSQSLGYKPPDQGGDKYDCNISGNSHLLPRVLYSGGRMNAEYTVPADSCKALAGSGGGKGNPEDPAGRLRCGPPDRP